MKPVFVALVLLGASAARAQTAVCVKVKLEIPQRLSFERDAFDASLGLTNNLADLTLDALDIEVQFRDVAGNRVDERFFVAPPALVAISGGVDGAGVIQPNTRGEARWLIVPSPGAGGTSLSGVQYDVRAVITYAVGGAPYAIDTYDERITVKPQPELVLDYFMPRRIYSDDPFTTPIEPAIPFELAVRVSNVGAGPARNLRIATAQPQIVDNQFGLLIDFAIVGTFLQNDTIANTLTLPFGTLEPSRCASGAWAMVTSVQGRFVDLDVSFEHKEELGGEKTSLIRAATKQWLVHRVLLDQPGRDAVPDFLADTSAGAGDGLPELVYDSECGELPVAVVPATSAGAPTPDTPTATITAQTQTGLIWFTAPDPGQHAYPIQSVTRASDDKRLQARNAWQWEDDGGVPSIAIFDDSYVGGVPVDYVIRYDMSAFDDLPPVSTLDMRPPFIAGTPTVIAATTIFTVTAIDDESGVARTEYRANGGAWLPASGPFFFQVSGPLTLEYRAVDNNGNEETPRSLDLLVDASAPQVTVHSPPPGRAWLRSETMLVDWSLSDMDPNAVAAARLVADGAAPIEVNDGDLVDLSTLTPGAWTLEVSVVDWLGQSDVVRVGPFSVQDEIGGCSGVPEGGPCDDGLFCTSGDACNSGVCAGGTAAACDDGDVCTDDICREDSDDCVQQPNTAPCDDASACTENDRCAAGTCAGTSISCDDGNACTDDTCHVATGCVRTANTAPCDDGNDCTTGDVCAGGTCTGGANAPEGTVCNDGALCTGPDRCDSGGVCVGATVVCDDAGTCDEQQCCDASNVACDDGNDCTEDFCSPASGCQHLFLPGCEPDGGPRDDGAPAADGGPPGGDTEPRGGDGAVDEPPPLPTQPAPGGCGCANAAAAPLALVGVALVARRRRLGS